MRATEEWIRFVDSVNLHLNELAMEGCDLPFFRGHQDSAWTLLPGLARRKESSYRKQSSLEAYLYYDFLTKAGDHVAPDLSSWDILFLMQHHGLPTRLLDWTDTFAFALFFAIRDIPFALGGIKEPEVDCSPVVWVLDASELNKQSTFGGAIPEPNSEVSDSYYDCFISEEKSFSDSALAILPPRRGTRLASQNGFFTFHSDLSKPLEQFSPKSVMKFELPRSAIPDAGRFLQLAGVNEYSAFPDLDGLARHLRSLHVDIPC